MDWDKLRIFHTVAQHKSLTRAGDALSLSQSAVSRQISALEEKLGIALFQLTIIATGSYNFFNLLTICLCLLLFDDQMVERFCPLFIRRRVVHGEAGPVGARLASLLAEPSSVCHVFGPIAAEVGKISHHAATYCRRLFPEWYPNMRRA